MQTEVAIIGAGPAGMAAALQLKRYGIDTLLFEKNQTDSLLKNAWQVENYLGFPKAKSGPQLLKIFHKHLKEHDIEPIPEQVQQLDYQKNKFTIKTHKTLYNAKYVIVASGTKPKPVSVGATGGSPGKTGGSPAHESPIFYEVFPLLKQRNKIIVIIGAGDAAFDFALNLAANNQIFLINRIKKIKALPILIDKVQQNKNITYKENHALQKVSQGTERDLLLNFSNGFIVEADFLLAAIGRIPQKYFYSENLLNQENQLLTTGYLHLAGDVKNAIYRQTSIAVADGVYAAMQIYNHITGELCK